MTNKSAMPDRSHTKPRPECRRGTHIEARRGEERERWAPLPSSILPPDDVRLRHRDRSSQARPGNAGASTIQPAGKLVRHSQATLTCPISVGHRKSLAATMDFPPTLEFFFFSN